MAFGERRYILLDNQDLRRTDSDISFIMKQKLCSKSVVTHISIRGALHG